MQCFYVSWGKRSEPPLSPKEDVKFEASNCLFRGALISVLADNIVDVYIHMPSGKDMWDALEAKFGVSDAGSELYVMEQFYDYKMVDDRSVVEQAHEIQMLAKELENNNCELPDKFVAGGIIAKLPPSWSDFATSLKHKQEFSVSDLIGSLGVEEKARAKDNRGKKVEGGSSANMVQKKNPHASHNNKKVKLDGKPKATTNFKKKGKGKAKEDCFVCGKSGHWAKDCPERKERKSANMVISEGGETSGVGYRFLIVNSGVPDMRVGTIIESRDAIFFDNEFPMKHTPSTSSQETVIPHEHFAPIEHNDQTPEGNPEDNIVDTLKSKRQRVAKSFGDDYIVYLVDNTPRTIEEAYLSPDADYWKEAVRSEMDSIMSNDTWEVVEYPYGCKPVGCKWVFKKKLRPDGTIEKYKVRLVAKDYTQKEGEDFFDTYSLVARLTTIRLLLALAASHGLLVHQMDVKTAFLNGELEEEIYMDQPDGYVLEGQEGMVCKLFKSLYGLKQAPKQWHEKFDTTLTSAGFVDNEADKCVYYRHGGGEGVILCLYVDDILIFWTSLNVIEEVKDYLSKSFEMKDLGEADVILNIKLPRGYEGGITLVQSHYVDKVLSRFGYSDCKPAPTPYDPSVLLRKNRRIARDQLRYSQIIGSLMYLASATRPNISFAVSKLSRFVSNPGDDHWQALERVMRYLKGTMSYGIHYTGYPKVLEGYSDSNWISDADEIKATSGYVFTLGGGAVS
uniref:Retrotransposon protein, putative, Ty1-copia subclass n=1 Tax=Oryza sativa subsp. japonica TaxID=39947 RepID=Q2QV75_ORYSJ|nr:retrotransposon protein, putative, Ty1-copia subclass [Oryza sativa Japonica Group]